MIEAIQWFKNGDHPDDASTPIDPREQPWLLTEGKIVRFFRHPNVTGETLCRECDVPMRSHGWIDTLEAGHNVCPSDWIITGIKGERYPCKPDIFAATYELVSALTEQELPNA